MKIPFLVIVLFILSTEFIIGQKSKVISVFQLIETEKYDDAKKAIEEAVLDKNTANWSRTWYARGYLCQIANDKKKVDLYPDQLYVAYESYEKARKYDTRGRIETTLAPLYVNLLNDFQKAGEKHYNSKKYDEALKSFELALKINRSPVVSSKIKIDTSLVYNTALSAYRNNEPVKAIGYLTGLHNDAYSPNASHMLFTSYLSTGDTASAQKVLLEGVNRYESNEKLVLLLVDLLHQTSNTEKALTILADASGKNPEKYIYPYTRGLLYQKTLKYQKAIEEYEKANKLDTVSTNASTNIGICYFNIGVEIEENARSITNNSVFLQEKAKSIEAFRSAMTWLEKSFDKNPADQKAASKLYQIYRLLQITDKITDLEK